MVTVVMFLTSLGSVPMAIIVVKGDMGGIATDHDNCADSSLSVAESADNNDACLLAAASLPLLKQIFDCEKLVWGFNDNAPFGECKHCNNVYAGDNATKAICHVFMIKGAKKVQLAS